MVEPIQAPSAPPLFAWGNITKSPITTLAGVVAAVAQYLAVQGPNVPSDAQGWASFAGGLVLAILLALYRGSASVKVAVPLVLFTLLELSCKPTPPTTPPTTNTPTPINTQVVSSLIVGATDLGCRWLIPPNDRPAVIGGLTLFVALLENNPAQALVDANTATSDINQNLGMGIIWGAIHNVLDTIDPNGWTLYGVWLLQTATTTCLRAII